MSEKTFLIISVCKEIFAVTSMFLRRIIQDSSMKQQWSISDSEVNTKKTIKIKIGHRNYRCFKYVSPKNHQRSWMKQQRNINVSEIRSKKTFMIFNLCKEIFDVTPMVLWRTINESPMKQQWNLSDSEFNTKKIIKIKKVAIEITNVSNMSLQKTINDPRQRSNELLSFVQRIINELSMN